MAVNIEIKALAREFNIQKQMAEALSDKPCQVIPQLDTFFNVPDGRFKLRNLGAGHPTSPRRRCRTGSSRRPLHGRCRFGIPGPLAG